jgi:hypothetical protein
MFPNKLAAIGICIVVAVGAVVLFALLERHWGAQSCVNADTKAGLQQEEKQVETHAAQTVEVAQEASDYDKALSDPVAIRIPVLVCAPPVAPHSNRVQETSSAASQSDAAAEHPAADPGAAVPGVAIGPGLLEVGKDADAQITALQTYITRVCQK